MARNTDPSVIASRARVRELKNLRKKLAKAGKKDQKVVEAYVAKPTQCAADKEWEAALTREIEQKHATREPVSKCWLQAKRRAYIAAKPATYGRPLFPLNASQKWCRRFCKRNRMKTMHAWRQNTGPTDETTWDRVKYNWRVFDGLMRQAQYRAAATPGVLIDCWNFDGTYFKNTEGAGKLIVPNLGLGRGPRRRKRKTLTVEYVRKRRVKRYLLQGTKALNSSASKSSTGVTAVTSASGHKIAPMVVSDSEGVTIAQRDAIESALRKSYPDALYLRDGNGYTGTKAWCNDSFNTSVIDHLIAQKRKVDREKGETIVILIYDDCTAHEFTTRSCTRLDNVNIFPMRLQGATTWCQQPIELLFRRWKSVSRQQASFFCLGEDIVYRCLLSCIFCFLVDIRNVSVKNFFRHGKIWSDCVSPSRPWPVTRCSDSL